jgi:phenylacetate-coenzyme A ligase PaaK-like adenylate-forming protein
VSPGQTSAKVLLTNLYNYTQPLTRYELTDRFIEIPGAYADGHLRAVIDGRNDAPFRYGERAVHPLAFRSVLVKAGEVFEYQVRQTREGVRVDVVAEPSLDVAALTGRLTAAMHAAGIDDAVATVKRVEQVERDPTTCKVRRFIPLA